MICEPHIGARVVLTRANDTGFFAGGLEVGALGTVRQGGRDYVYVTWDCREHELCNNRLISVTHLDRVMCAP